MKKILMLLTGISIVSNPMCFRKAKSKKAERTAQSKEPELDLSKDLLMQLINRSDLNGIRTFTQKGGVKFIDEEACTLAQTKFEATGVKDPAQWSKCNEFLVKVMVQALAPSEVKQQLGLPVDDA